MNEVSDMFVKGFCAKCAERGIDPEALIKSGFIGSLIRTGKEMGQTSNQIATGRQKSMMQYGNKGFMGRMGQRLWDPIQASRNAKGYGIGVGQQPQSVQQAPQGAMGVNSLTNRGNIMPMGNASQAMIPG